MATAAEEKALLAVPCPWCGARPGQRCYTMAGKKALPITTLDGGSHDLRWRVALDLPARVIWPEPAEEIREPVPVGAAIERPW